MLPPTTGHGCARGLAGAANSSTADAPIGATMNGSADGPMSNACAVHAATSRPSSDPSAARR